MLIIVYVYAITYTIENKGKVYIIEAKHRNIKEKICKKVINFDECYTTELGGLLHPIKPTFICGQYLA